MEKLKFLVVGSGGREYIIVKRLSEEAEVYAFMFHENPGIADLVRGYTLGKPSDIDRIVEYALRIKPDIVVVGPEDPLAHGIVDRLEGKGVACVGPTREAAKIEWDKSFARMLMEKYNIPGKKL